MATVSANNRRVKRLPVAVAVAVLGLGVAACGDDGSGGAIDSSLPVIDSAVPDANTADGRIDASLPCSGQVQLTGEYVDWDSTDTSFLGVADATAVEVGNAGNTATTAPNGRVLLCLPASTDSDVSFTQASYLPMVFSADADVVPLGPGFSTRGLTPARAITLAAELGVATFTGTQVLVEVRDFTSGPPTAGIVLALPGNTFEKAFALNDSGQWIESSTSGAGGYVLFTNVADDGLSPGSAGLRITPGGGETCDGRSAVTLVAGGIAATSVHCL